MRSLADLFNHDGLDPDKLTETDIETKLQSVKWTLREGLLVPYDPEKDVLEHDSVNGNTAAFYANHPLFQRVVSGFIDSKKVQLLSGHDVVIADGRARAGSGGLSILFQADLSTRIAVRQKEDPKAKGMTDEEIIADLINRDKKDIGSGIFDPRPDNSYVVFWPDIKSDTENAVVEALADLAESKIKGEELSPIGQIYPPSPN